MTTLPTPILTGLTDDVNAMDAHMSKVPELGRVCGVDFSGASRSGKTAWLAEFEVVWPAGSLQLVSLAALGKLAGSDQRDAVCEYLVARILESHKTLWAMDFPFALPIELGGEDWLAQLERLPKHRVELAHPAAQFGRQLAVTASRLVPHSRIRRKTEIETATPFDSYHYRIIYQTFHGMRDVLLPIAKTQGTAVIPFQYSQMSSAERIVLESCPASSLKRWALPRTCYKQTGGRPLEPIHRLNRLKILRGIRVLPQLTQSPPRTQGSGSSIGISQHRQRVIMQDPGGDALDAVLAGLGGWRAIHTVDHHATSRDSRYRFEGRVYS